VRSPESSRPARGESRGACQERTRYGYTFYVRVADVDRTHRASSSPRGRKAPRCTRALAGRKLEASPDAGHARRNGESVRGHARGLERGFRSARAVGFGSRVLDTTEGVLGLRLRHLTGGGAQGSYGSRVNPLSRRSLRKERVTSNPADSASVGKEAGRACPGATRGRQRSTRFGEGSARSERIERGPHPRR